MNTITTFLLCIFIVSGLNENEVSAWFFKGGRGKKSPAHSVSDPQDKIYNSIDEIDLKRYEYKNRLLISHSPSDTEPEFLKLEREIEAHRCEFDNRNLLHFRIRDKWGFRVELIRYDRQAVMEQERVNLQEIFDVIDKMYMRKQEMKDDQNCDDITRAPTVAKKGGKKNPFMKGLSAMKKTAVSSAKKTLSVAKKVIELPGKVMGEFAKGFNSQVQGKQQTLKPTIPIRNGCDTMCIENYAPVCDSDGKTHSNECWFNIANCKQGYTLQIVSKGECRTIWQGCDEICTREYSPVCGSDDRSYSNYCMFKIANCKSGGKLEIVSKGQCSYKGPPTKRPTMGRPHRGPSKGRPHRHPMRKPWTHRHPTRRPWTRRPHTHPTRRPWTRRPHRHPTRRPWTYRPRPHARCSEVQTSEGPVVCTESWINEKNVCNGGRMAPFNEKELADIRSCCCNAGPTRQPQCEDERPHCREARNLHHLCHSPQFREGCCGTCQSLPGHGGRRGTPPPKFAYILGKLGSDSCSIGSMAVTKEEECKLTAKVLGIEYYGGAVTWRDNPKNCFLTDGNTVYFNRRTQGELEVRIDSQPICKRNVHPTGRPRTRPPHHIRPRPTGFPKEPFAFVGKGACRQNQQSDWKSLTIMQPSTEIMCRIKCSHIKDCDAFEFEVITKRCLKYADLGSGFRAGVDPENPAVCYRKMRVRPSGRPRTRPPHHSRPHPSYRPHCRDERKYCRESKNLHLLCNSEHFRRACCGTCAHIQGHGRKKGTPPPKYAYILGKLGSDSCTIGSMAVTSEAECKLSAKVLGIEYYGGAVTWRDNPKNCFVTDGNTVYFNRRSQGELEVRIDSQPICKRNVRPTGRPHPRPVTKRPLIKPQPSFKFIGSGACRQNIGQYKSTVMTYRATITQCRMKCLLVRDCDAFELEIRSKRCIKYADLGSGFKVFVNRLNPAVCYVKNKVQPSGRPGTKNPSGEMREECLLPKEIGVCKAFFPRYFYNSHSRKCDKFIYGGCGGNKNNFKTLEDCRKTCASTALKQIGESCGHSMIRHHGDCEKGLECRSDPRIMDAPGVCQKKVVQSTVPCTLCKLVVGKLNSMLSSKRTEKAVEDALDQVCDQLPSAYAKECDTFVKEYTEKIIDLFVKQYDPKSVCTLLTLCTDRKVHPAKGARGYIFASIPPQTRYPPAKKTIDEKKRSCSEVKTSEGPVDCTESWINKKNVCNGSEMAPFNQKELADIRSCCCHVKTTISPTKSESDIDTNPAESPDEPEEIDLATNPPTKSTTTGQPVAAAAAEVEIAMAAEFRDELKDSKSDAFVELKLKVETEMDKTLREKAMAGYIGVEVLSFRAGSTIAQTRILFATVEAASDTPTVSKTLTKAIQDGKLDTLGVKKSVPIVVEVKVLQVHMHKQKSPHKPPSGPDLTTQWCIGAALCLLFIAACLIIAKSYMKFKGRQTKITQSTTNLPHEYNVSNQAFQPDSPRGLVDAELPVYAEVVSENPYYAPPPRYSLITVRGVDDDTDRQPEEIQKNGEPQGMIVASAPSYEPALPSVDSNRAAMFSVNR